MFYDSARGAPRSFEVPMSAIRSICVYCGSGFGDDPVFAENAAALGRSMAEQGINLVYGGGNVGLMGTVAQSVLDHGGYFSRDIPHFLDVRGKVLHGVEGT